MFCEKLQSINNLSHLHFLLKHNYRCSIPYLCYNLEFDSSNLTSWFIPESDDLYVTVLIEFGTLSPDMKFKWNIREMHSDGTLLPFDQVQQDTYTEGK